MAVLKYQIIGENVSLNQAVKQSVASLNTLESAANKANEAIKREITPINELKRAVAELNKQKVNITDIDKLARQNKLIQELEAEITRFGNAGKAGFDNIGNALEKSKSGLEGFGKGLTGGLGLLRQVAYILPGIGVAGLFNLAFEAIGKASESLGVFNSRLTLSQSNLNNLNDVTKDAAKQFGEQATNLRILYAATQDVTNSTRDRTLAARELQKEFPDTFKNIQIETILNGGASESYKKLTVDILDNAKAKAAASKISELSAKQLQSEFQVQKIKNAQAAETKRLNAQIQGGDTFNVEGGGILEGNAQKQINDRANKAIKIEQQNQKELKQQQDFLVAFAGGNNKIAKALSTNNTPTVKTAGSGGENLFASISSSLDDIFNKTKSLANESGLQGYALEVQKVTDKYISLNKQIDDNVAKAVRSNGRKGGITDGELGTIQSKAERDRQDAARAKEKELSDLKIAEAQRVANEVERIRNEFGIKAEQSRAKEILQITAKYDAEVVKAKGNAEILTALNEGRLVAIQAINDKYAAIEQDLQDKIAAIDAQARADIAGKQESDTQKIQSEWDKRKDAAGKYYDELKRLAASAPGVTGNAKIDSIVKGVNIGSLTNKQTATNTGIDNAASADISRKLLEPLTNGLSRSVRQFGQDFLETITSVDTYAKGSFASIFSDLTAKLSSSLNKVFFDVVLNGLSSVLTKAISNGTSNLIGKDGKVSGDGAIALGGGLAGGILSAATPKTSTGGQVAGGALSGAAAGFAIGGPWGAAIGGVVGALSGIFGSSSARKEEEARQKQMLEEQKKQTQYLSLAYTSQIIGRMTANGVVTGINVGAFGQLVATVAGKDLQFVLDRNANGR